MNNDGIADANIDAIAASRLSVHEAFKQAARATIPRDADVEWAQALKDIWRARLTEMREHMQYVRKYRAEIAKIHAAIMAAVPTVFCQITNTLDFRLSGTKSDLLNMIRVLRRAGYHPYERPAENATQHSCYYSPSGEAAVGADEFRVWISFCSKQCKRVQTGTRMEEVPVYEVQCD